MDTSTYDAKIEAAIAEAESLAKQMNETQALYINACTGFFRQEFPQTIESAIASKPEVTKNLGLEKLRELKAELKEVVDNVPRIVSEHLGKADIWEHNKTPPEELNDSNAFNIYYHAGENARSELGKIMGHVGQLIIKYGFDQDGKYSIWKRQATGLPQYGAVVAHLNPQVEEPIKQYKELYKTYVNTHLKIKELKIEKERAIAKDLWNQA